MKTIFALVISLTAIFAIGCQGGSPATTAQPSPSAVSAPHKLGADLNNASEIAAIAVETGIAEWPKTSADGAAATATSETSFGLIGSGPQAIPVGSCQFHTSGALTANASNYATLSVYKRTNGGSATLLAQLATTTTSWTAFTNVSIPVQSGAYVSPGDSLTVAITKTGTGVVVPQGQLACFTTIN